MNVINLIELEKGEGRQRYDLATPPCILLRFEHFKVEVMDDFRTKLFQIRKELSRFFEEEKNLRLFSSQ